MDLLRFTRLFFVILCAGALLLTGGNSFVPFSNGLGVSVAQAQQKERSPGLFDLLFRNNKDKAKPQVKKVPRAKKQPKPRAKIRKKVPRKKKVVRRSTKPRAAAVVAPPKPKVEKAENARRVLVVGDFIADGMSEGLEASFADVENVVIDKRTNGSSGLVRDDFYNWPQEVVKFIEEVKPSIVVVMLGSNDRQAMRVNGRTEKVRSAAWEAEYISRVNALVEAVRGTNTPLMWVGSPPFRFRKMSADILAFNELYRQATEANNGIFVDIWDGFVDENGNFIITGADVKGQQVRLRAGDGINFTKAGKQKLAFYVERQLKQLLGDAASPLLTSLANENAPMLMLPPLQPEEANLERTNPMNIGDPELDGGNILLGDVTKQQAVANNPLQAKSVRQRLVEDGVPPPDQPGRTGNFNWPG